VTIPPDIQRRDQPRRIADRVIDDLYKTFSTCLERMADAVLLLDKERRVIYATSQVEQIMSRLNMPFALTPKFTLYEPAMASRFTAFVNGKNSEAGPLSLMLGGEKDHDFLLLTCYHLPAPPTPESHVVRYMVTVRYPNRYPVRQWHFFTEQFNLTSAEARLCRALADGLMLSDYCNTRRITISTARSQLSSVFAKTSTKRQTDLLRLIYLFMRT
jgi:DNA-binding CsgD family transcriptional regulator